MGAIQFIRRSSHLPLSLKTTQTGTFFHKPSVPLPIVASSRTFSRHTFFLCHTLLSLCIIDPEPLFSLCLSFELSKSTEYKFIIQIYIHTFYIKQNNFGIQDVIRLKNFLLYKHIAFKTAQQLSFMWFMQHQRFNVYINRKEK